MALERSTMGMHPFDDMYSKRMHGFAALWALNGCATFHLTTLFYLIPTTYPDHIPNPNSPVLVTCITI